jgi:alpha-glucosidase
MQSDISSTAESNDGLLRVHVYKGSSGSTFVHYEDDGISHDYHLGDYLEQEFSYDSESNQVKIGSSIGNYKSDYNSIRIYFHGFDIDKVLVDQKSVSLAIEDYAFLGKLTEFDPLPEHDHSYLEIKNLTFLELKFNSKETIIQLT